MNDNQIKSEKINKIYCANCMNCKLILHEISKAKYVHRIRCSAGKWKKKSGNEKYYKYSTIMRRCMKECPDYSPMGESEKYIKELRRDLEMGDEFFFEEDLTKTEESSA